MIPMTSLWLGKGFYFKYGDHRRAYKTRRVYSIADYGVELTLKRQDYK